jgi:ankyrin repeat protein
VYLSQRGRTALMYAVAKGNLDLINLLLDVGADASAKDTVGPFLYYTHYIS